MQLTVVTATGKRCALELAPAGEASSLAALQAAVGRSLGLAPQAAAGLRLVCSGQAVADDAAASRLKDGDTLLAVVAPKPPPKAVREQVAGTSGQEAEEDDELRLRLRPDAPAWQRQLAHFLQHRLRVPEALLALAVRAGWRFWLGLLAWMVGARLAAGYELGPIYIITTLFALMLLNLGQRGEGEWSAYSLFNPNFRRLPGQMTAEDLDRQVRRGNM